MFRMSTRKYATRHMAAMTTRNHSSEPRRIRCSVAPFANLGARIDGSPLLATIPATIATQIRATRPHLRAAKLPFALSGAATELLWPGATDDDGPSRFVMEDRAWKHVHAPTSTRAGS